MRKLKCERRDVGNLMTAKRMPGKEEENVNKEKFCTFLVQDRMRRKKKKQGVFPVTY